MKNFKLNPEDKKKWVDALRSGEYKQCTGVLCDARYRYCCLGVANVIGLCKPHKKYGRALVDVSFLPHEIQTTLACMNDGSGRKKHTFLEMADYIEENL